MSVKLMTLVWERADLSQSETLVGLALADHADDDGECWPSLERIAAKARLKKRQTQRVIQRLEELGLVQVERAVGRRNTNCYRFVFHGEQKDVAVTPFIEPVKGVMGDAEKVSPVTEKVSPDATKGVTAMTPESPVTIIEPPEEPPGLDSVAWDRFVSYRKEIRKAIKPASIPASQRLLAGFAADQAAVVEQTIANGWQGLFPLKTRGPAPLPERRKLTRYEQMQEALRNATET